MKIETKFMKEFAKIKNEVFLFGICSLLNISCADKDFPSLFDEIMVTYSKKPKKIKRQLLYLLEMANRED